MNTVQEETYSLQGAEYPRTNNYQDQSYLLDRVVRFFMETNCLYLLSALLLLIGAYLMIHSEILSSNHTVKTFQIYGIIQCYEIALIAIFLYVVRKLKVPEDGLVLAGIEILLFLDPLFFNNVFYTISMRIGLLSGVLGLALLAAKFLIVFKLGGLPFIPRLNGAIFATAAFTYFYPVVLVKDFYGGFAATAYYYLCWMPFLLTLVIPEIKNAVEKMSEASPFSDKQKKGFLVAVSMILMYVILSHLYESHGVFDMDSRVLFGTPFLLSLCILLPKLNPNWFSHTLGKMFVWVVSIIGILLSYSQEAMYLTYDLWGFKLSCLSVVLLGATYVHYFLWKKTDSQRHLVAAGVVATMFFSGPNPSAIFDNLSSFYAPPFVFLTVLSAVLAWYLKSRLFTFITGILFLLAAFKLGNVKQYEYGYFMLAQAVGYWILISMELFKMDKDFKFRTVLAVILLTHTFVNVVRLEEQALYTSYFWAQVLLFFGLGLLFNIISLTFVSVSGAGVQLLYMSRHKLNTAVLAVPRGIKTGVLMVILSFIVLGLGLMVSVRKSKMKDWPPPQGGGGPDIPDTPDTQDGPDYSVTAMMVQEV